MNTVKKFFTLSLLLVSINCFSQTITEIFLPQYIQGVGSSNASDDRKVPFACRMRISGLNPNVTYRYYNRFVPDPSVVSSNGQGNYIIVTQAGSFLRVTSASLATAGRYGEFTTDAAGSYTGWFVSEASIATDFQPGTILYFRLMLNNGAGGGTVATRITNSTPITVLGWGAAPNQGTGLRCVANNNFLVKNFVMFYDNDAGTGRPVAGTFVESDGTDNNAITSGYAPFYATNVDNVNNTWGTIIPNNLSSGIRKISQYALSDGAYIGAAVSSNGVFPAPSGTANTVNANSGLTELVISPSVVLPVTLNAFSASVISSRTARLIWNSLDEVNLNGYEIERSEDAVNFSKIGFSAARGSNSIYQYQDQQMRLRKKTYYRLGIMDFDGKKSYSKIVSVETTGDAALQIQPNPAFSEATVSHPAAQMGSSIQIFSANGMLLLKQNLLSGSLQTKIGVQNLRPGHYVLAFINGKERIKTFLSKQ